MRGKDKIKGVEIISAIIIISIPFKSLVGDIRIR